MAGAVDKRSFNSNSTATNNGDIPAGVSMNPPPNNTCNPGDVSMMAWSDYYWGYIHESKAKTRERVSSGEWVGGINLTVMDDLEQFSTLAFGYIRDQAPPTFANRSVLDSQHFGTCNGLSRLPYVRDTRRSIGLDGFLLNLTALAKRSGQHTSIPWHDKVALAYHGVDIWGHRMKPFGNLYPSYMQKGYSIDAPSYIPLRALTNANVTNFLVS